MTQSELALFETLKILLNQLIASQVVDYKQTRETLQARAEMFRKTGYNDAAATMATLRMAIEPRRKETVSSESLIVHKPPDLSHAIVLDT